MMIPGSSASSPALPGLVVGSVTNEISVLQQKSFRVHHTEESNRL